MEKVIDKNNTGTTLSTLWVVVMFLMLKADILSLYVPGTAEKLAEFAGGTPITQLMLGGAVMMTIPTAMIFLSRTLEYRINRWANIFSSIITIIFVISGGSTYPHYIYLASIEVACMLLIFWYAWTWPKTSK